MQPTGQFDPDLYRLFFDDCPEALIAVRDGVVLGANREAHRMLGSRQESSLAGRRLEEIIPMDLGSRNGLHSALGRLTPGDVRCYEWELGLPGGTYVPVTIKAVGLAGGPVLLSIRDCGPARERDRLLSEIESQRAALVDATPTPTVCVDRQFRIVWANEPAARMAGERPQDLPGRNCFSALAKRTTYCTGCPAALAIRALATSSSEVSLGDQQYVVSASPMRSPDGTASGAVICHAESLAVFETPEGCAEMPAFGGMPAVPESSAMPLASPDAAASWDGPRQACADGTHLVDLDVLVSSACGEMSNFFGVPVTVMPSGGSATVHTHPELLLDTIRRLAQADFGTCLDPDEGILIRVDWADVPGSPGVMSPGRYLSVSMGSSEVLSSASQVDFSSSPHRFVSPFPMGARHSGEPAGAVFVSRDSRLRPFYQIFLSSQTAEGGVLR
jgi:PAS domain-containing protein